jgi:hypothetical protein
VGVEPESFDLEAAWLRRAQTDLAAFMEALAVRLEGALPQHVTVERRKDGLFSKASHVRAITLRGDKAEFRLTRAGGVAEAVRAKVVRGVVISTNAIPMEQWLSEIRAELSALAGRATAAADVLHDFL